MRVPVCVASLGQCILCMVSFLFLPLVSLRLPDQSLSTDGIHIATSFLVTRSCTPLCPNRTSFRSAGGTQVTSEMPLPLWTKGPTKARTVLKLAAARTPPPPHSTSNCTSTYYPIACFFVHCCAISLYLSGRVTHISPISASNGVSTTGASNIRTTRPTTSLTRNVGLHPPTTTS